MINRRNIRVKVMQTLYTITTLEAETKPGDVVKILQNILTKQGSYLFISSIFCQRLPVTPKQVLITVQVNICQLTKTFMSIQNSQATNYFKDQ